MKRVALALLLTLSPLPLLADAVDDAIARADRQKPKEALATLEAAAKSAPKDARLMAELALAWTDVADISDKKDAQQAAEKASELADAAVTAAPKLCRAHLARAVAMGKMTDFVDNKTKMALSRQIREAALKAIELNPKEALAYEIIGRWEYGFATLNPLAKAGARVVFGKLPDASLENSASYLLKAVELAPRRISPRYALAQTYKAMGEKEKLQECWKVIVTLSPSDAEDQAAVREARKALGK